MASLLDNKEKVEFSHLRVSIYGVSIVVVDSKGKEFDASFFDRPTDDPEYKEIEINDWDIVIEELEKFCFAFPSNNNVYRRLTNMEFLLAENKRLKSQLEEIQN